MFTKRKKQCLTLTLNVYTVAISKNEWLRLNNSAFLMGGVTYLFVSSCLGLPTFFRWRYIAIRLARTFASCFEKPHASMHCGMVALGHLILNATALWTRSGATPLILGMLVSSQIKPPRGIFICASDKFICVYGAKNLTVSAAI